MSSFTGSDPTSAWTRIKRGLDSIQNEANREVVETYLNERAAGGLRMTTIAADMDLLKTFCGFVGDTDLKAVDRATVVRFLNQPRKVREWRNRDRGGNETVTRREVPLKDSTKHQRKVRLRAFYVWLEPERGPDLFKGIRMKKPALDSIPTDHLITEQDIRRLIQDQTTTRGKALFAVLLDSGFRASEFCSLNVGSVQFDEYGAVLTLPRGSPGLKTGARRVRLFESVPYLHAFYEDHPFKDNPAAPLFYSDSRRAPKARMTANALWKFVHDAGERAGLGKSIKPHLFRHSCATEWARRGFNEYAMRGRFGWSRSSDMPSRYVHLAGLDYENMELEQRGLLKDGESSRPILAGVVCRACKTENLPTAIFCQSCRHPVNPDVEAEMAERRRLEVKEAAAGMFAEELKRQVAAEVRRLATDGMAEDRVAAEE